MGVLDLAGGGGVPPPRPFRCESRPTKREVRAACILADSAYLPDTCTGRYTTGTVWQTHQLEQVGGRTVYQCGGH